MNINPNGQAGNSDPLLEKGLPSNVEAERSILGAILLDNAVCNQAIELMRRDDFFLDSHRHIFDKMVALTERGIPIDLVTLENELRNVNEFEQIGGATFIASLIGGVPRTDTIEHYAKIVKRKALLRGALARSSHLASRITDGGDDEELISFVSEQVSAFNETIRESVGNLTEQSGRRKLITVDELEA
jgi:replicative DNA helicase